MTTYGHNITPDEIRAMIGTAPFIIEVGCNDGTDTAAMLKAMPDARFVCFEPEQRALARFALRDDPRVTLHEVGVLHRCGQFEFWPSTGSVPQATQAPCKADWDYSGSFAQPTGHLRRSPEISFKLPQMMRVATLDTYYREYRHPVDLLWIDGQGSEAKVILGGRDTLLNTRYIYTEFYNVELYAGEPDLTAIRAFLPDFDLLATYGDNALFKNRTL